MKWYSWGIEGEDRRTAPKTGAGSHRACSHQRERAVPLEPQVLVGPSRRRAAAGSALKQSALEQIGLVDVLDRVLLLPHRHRQGRQPHRAAPELLAQGAEDLAVQAVEAERIDF